MGCEDVGQLQMTGKRKCERKSKNHTCRGSDRTSDHQEALIVVPAPPTIVPRPSSMGASGFEAANKKAAVG